MRTEATFDHRSMNLFTSRHISDGKKLIEFFFILHYFKVYDSAKHRLTHRRHRRDAIEYVCIARMFARIRPHERV